MVSQRKHTFKLLSYSLLLYVLIEVFLFVIIFLSYNAEKKNIENSTAYITEILSEEIEKTLQKGVQMLIGLQDLLEVSKDAYTPFSPQIHNILRKHIESNEFLRYILVINQKGEIIHWTEDVAPPSVKDRDYVLAHVDPDSAGKIFLGMPNISRAHNNVMFFPVSISSYYEDSGLMFVFAAIFSSDYFNKLLKKYQFSDNLNITLVKNSGEVITSLDDNLSGAKIDLNPFIFHKPSMSYSKHMETSLAPESNIYSYADMNKFPLKVIANYPSYKVWKNILGELIIVIVISIFLTYFFVSISRKIILYQDKLDEQIKLLANQATRDSLTGLYNRRAILKFAEIEMNKFLRYNRTFSVIILDIDFFKDINDQYGHDAGDFALKEITKEILELSRDMDFVGRYGGEEFLIILPETNLHGAFSFAERMRKSISDRVFEFDRYQNKIITISCGVADSKSSDKIIDEIIKRADIALYRAKEHGRNRTEKEV